MELHIDTSDLEKFERQWKKASPIIREEMLTAMTRSVLITEGQAKQMAPVKTGTLRRSITHEVAQMGGTVVGQVGTNVPYAKYVHNGTQAHVIEAVSKKALFWKGARHPVKKVTHPGTKANPFMKNALAAKRSAIQLEFRKAMQRVAQRLAS